MFQDNKYNIITINIIHTNYKDQARPHKIQIFEVLLNIRGWPVNRFINFVRLQIEKWSSMLFIWQMMFVFGVSDNFAPSLPFTKIVVYVFKIIKYKPWYQTVIPRINLSIKF